MNDKSDHRPYNSVVIDNYLSYLSENYPEVAIGPILNEANIKPWEVSDPGHWFTQDQVNEFHAALTRRIKDTSETTLARAVGRFTASERSNKFMRLSAIHLLRPENIFPIASKISAKFIKSVDVGWEKIHDSKYEVIVTFRKGIRPRRFQCENYLGNVEAFIRIFTNKWPKVEHAECFFKGHDRCRYIVSWEKERYYYVNKLRSCIIFLTPLACGFLYLLSGYIPAIALAVIGLALIHHMKIYSELIEKRNSIAAFKRNDYKILDLYDALCNFHDYTAVFGEAAKSISSHASVEKVLQKFSTSLQGLGYNKGLICLYDDKTNNLHIRHIYGFTGSKRDMAGQFKDMPLTSAKNIKTIQMHDKMSDLSDLLPNKVISEFGDINELLVIPMIYERSLIGIIITQNERGHENLTGSDISLVQAVASQTALVITNISAFEAVTASEKLKNQFLTIASHELRTPIQAIFLAYDDLNEKLNKEKKTELKRSLTAIEKGVVRLENIVDNLLNMSKIEARGSLDEKPVYIAELIDQARHETEYIIRLAKHRLIIRNQFKKNEKVLCDDGLLVQVMTNLINNAAKFTEKKGLIMIRAYRDKAELIFDVIDNGRGIPGYAREKVFMKFYQADRDGPTIENDGCGLGLPFCKEIIQKHGGYISMESPLNKNECPDMGLNESRKGTLFRVHLPLERLGTE